jgi:hypothetical protein
MSSRLRGFNTNSTHAIGKRIVARSRQQMLPWHRWHSAASYPFASPPVKCAAAAGETRSAKLFSSQVSAGSSALVFGKVTGKDRRPSRTVACRHQVLSDDPLLALLCQFRAARSIIEVAIRPLNHLTEQAKFRFSKASKERPRGHSAPKRARGGLAAFSRGLPIDLADRDLVWRRTDTVALSRFLARSVPATLEFSAEPRRARRARSFFADSTPQEATPRRSNRGTLAPCRGRRGTPKKTDSRR